MRFSEAKERSTSGAPGGERFLAALIQNDAKVSFQPHYEIAHTKMSFELEKCLENTVQAKVGMVFEKDQTSTSELTPTIYILISR